MKNIYILILITFISSSTLAKASISLSRFETGYNDSPEALIFPSGKLFKTHRSTHSSFIISHPKGNLLIDTGLGLKIDEQFEDFIWWLKPFFGFTKEVTIQESLSKHHRSIDSIFLTHLHWDHASGITDFPQAIVFTTKTEREYALETNDSHGPGYLRNQYDSKSIKWKDLELRSIKYGPFEQSLDIFSDGSLIAVPLPGHTPGSLGYILTLRSGRQLFFVGDVIWSVKQLNNLEHKFAIAKCLVDDDPEQLLETIKKIALFKNQRPELQIIPANDYKHIKSLIPLFPKFIDI